MKLKPKSRWPLIACLCAALLTAGISGSIVAQTSGSSASKAGSSSASAQTAALDSEVFPKDKVVDVKITINEDDFQNMLDNASAEEMKTASVDYNGEHFDNVGIRTKGNLTLRSVVNMDDSDRYSFKLSFDEYVSSQTLRGISKINLNNNYSDASYMREFLTYELAEEMGLPTPKYSFVNVYVNGKLWGFYLAVEQIGDAYLERNFGNSYGALYKGENGNGSDLKWIDDSLSSYSGLVQKSKSSNKKVLIDMLDELNNGTDYAKVLNVEEALKYIALNVVTVNTDSYLGGNKQNYYLYENNGIFSVLPWDYNMAFGGLGRSSLLIDEPTQGAVAERPLIAKLLGVDEYKQMYHDIIQKAVQGYLAPDTFKARVQQVDAMISAYVKQDPSSFYTYEQYESGVEQLISTNTSQVDNISQQLAGTIASSNDGNGSGGGFGGGGPGGQGGMNGQMPEGAGFPAEGGKGNTVAAMAFNGPDNAQGGQQGPQAQGNAQGNQESPQAQGNAQGNQQQGQGNGQGWQNRQGGPGGGQGGGGFGGPPGGQGPGQGPNSAATQGNTSEAVATGVSIIVLGLACLFVTLYKRKRI
ncbi:Inner spore coat protein H [Paenibacillus konkukensis]|uniref:Inner spore coat protein H n=1 Tax=Paenibacillus konkukensis TaxID=2020716 RepID=A0ABY4RP44_9BACL|nr:CotH kinase family protein [Paenibacillus konkukensis]UQZ83918.1 Inner spore coat protein H [Paenibacillus konkukensis]